MNRINKLFKTKGKDILSIYYTAGFPQLNDTVRIAQAVEQAGGDMIEIGIPFSDPVADGPTIQASNKKALDNGMKLSLLFEQLATLRDHVSIPVILMGYINPVIQYGIEKFCADCKKVGVDGLILPDLPVTEYEQEYKATFDQHDLRNIFLITPQTSTERIRTIDEQADGFIYMVSSAATTGAKDSFGKEAEAYFNRVKGLSLKNPTLVGFGISNNITFKSATSAAQGAIIGSAFIKTLEQEGDLKTNIEQFIEKITTP